MIAKMDQLTVVGRRSIARELLQSLQSLGVVQIDPLEPEEGLALARLELHGRDKADSERWAAALARTATLLDTLSASDATPAARSELPTDLDQLETYLSELGAQVDAVVAERAEVRDELDLVRTYLPLFRALAPMLAQLEGSRYLEGTPVLVPADDADATRADLAAALEDRVAFTSRPYGRQTLLLLVTLKQDRSELRRALSRFGLSPLTLPPRYEQHGTAKAVHVMEERSQALPRRLSDLEAELADLAANHGPRLKLLEQVAGNNHARYERLEDMLAGRYGFAMRGWVPSEDSRRVVDALKKQFGEDLVTVTRPADEHHDVGVPVKLENKRWVRPFELLLSLFAPPRYGTFDPSWTVAVFFPLFFGIVVGDIGFGLLFLALGLWLQRRGRAGKELDLGPLGIVIPPESLVPIGTMANWCAFWSIVWGVVFGEFLGNFLERWPAGNPVFYVPGHGEGIFAIPIFRIEQFTPLLILTIGFGVLQVIGGWGIRAYYGYLHKDRKHLWEGIGMMAGLAAVVLFAAAYLTGNLSPLVMTLFAIGMVVFLAGVVLSGVPLMLVELISNSGNILSYLRLFAVGLSAALVANLGTDLGFAIAGAIPVPVLGPLLGIVVTLIVHFLAIALTLIGHTLQPLRLQYVEFFTKFGFYEQSGRPYEPFRLSGGKA